MRLHMRYEELSMMCIKHLGPVYWNQCMKKHWCSS